MQADAGTSRHTQVPVGIRRYQQAHAGRIIGRRLLPILPDKSKYRGRTSVFGVVVAASHVTESDTPLELLKEQFCIKPRFKISTNLSC